MSIITHDFGTLEALPNTYNLVNQLANSWWFSLSSEIMSLNRFHSICYHHPQIKINKNKNKLKKKYITSLPLIAIKTFRSIYHVLVYFSMHWFDEKTHLIKTMIKFNMTIGFNKNDQYHHILVQPTANTNIYHSSVILLSRHAFICIIYSKHIHNISAFYHNIKLNIKSLTLTTAFLNYHLPQGTLYSSHS